MNEEQIPLKSMGTQSRDTMNMAAAMTPAAVLSRQREFEDALAPLGGVADDAGAVASTARSKVRPATPATIRSGRS